MWYADWMPARWTGADGKCLMVRTPDGDWAIDGPSGQGRKWVRVGVPPCVTVTPPVLQERFHAMLTNGQLLEVE
jgi:hypothetical protein